jgi:hypothetical protein
LTLFRALVVTCSRLDAILPSIGVGTLLVERMKELCRADNWERLWVITSNDNLAAVRFYQGRGFHIGAIYSDAITRARELEPNIPRVGEMAILVRDMVELFELHAQALYDTAVRLMSENASQ